MKSLHRLFKITDNVTINFLYSNIQYLYSALPLCFIFVLSHINKKKVCKTQKYTDIELTSKCELHTVQRNREKCYFLWKYCLKSFQSTLESRDRLNFFSWSVQIITNQYKSLHNVAPQCRCTIRRLSILCTAYPGWRFAMVSHIYIFILKT